MKTNNFITQIGQLLYENLNLAWKMLAAITALALAISPLFITNPANLWYLPMTGIMLFMLALIGDSVWQPRSYRMTITEPQIDTSGTRGFGKTIGSKFANQESANEHQEEKAA